MYRPGRQFQPGFPAERVSASRPIERAHSQRRTLSPVQTEEERAALLSAFPSLLELESLEVPQPPQSPLSQALAKQFAEPLSFRVQATQKQAGHFSGKRGLLIFGGSGVLLLLLLVSLWLSMQASTAVTLFQVQKQSITQVIGGGGTLYPQRQTTVTYPVRERVLEVFAHIGDSVSSGQPLLRLDTTQSTAQLQQAADNINTAQTYLTTVSMSGNALTIAQARQQFSLAKNKYTALQSQLSYPLLHAGLLLSPLQGVVTSLTINAGEVLIANAPLLIIVDESSLFVHMQVPLANVGQVHPGQKARIIPTALSNRTFSGVVNTVIPQANPQTDTFEVWVTVDDPQHLLLPGMSTFVSILMPTSALVVPRLSVLLFEQLATVFVVREQHAYLRAIQVSGRCEDHLLVSAGLNQGDVIVLVGLDRLRNGQAIAVRAIERPNGGRL